MFLFVPYGTDAPVYHFPYATIGLIVINTLMFLGFCQELDNGSVPELETPSGKRFSVKELAAYAENDQDDSVIQTQACQVARERPLATAAFVRHYPSLSQEERLFEGRAPDRRTHRFV